MSLPTRGRAGLSQPLLRVRIATLSVALGIGLISGSFWPWVMLIHWTYCSLMLMETCLNLSISAQESPNLLSDDAPEWPLFSYYATSQSQAEPAVGQSH